MKTDQYLINFYDHYDEENRLLAKHGSVEFLTTMRYIEKYIKMGDHVLEVGAGYKGSNSCDKTRRRNFCRICYIGWMPSG